MKQKYRILENHYDDGSVWFLPQVGDWWHGWRYLCKPHPCPEAGWIRIAYKTLDEADTYIKDLIERTKNGTTSSNKPCTKWPPITKIHNYNGDCHD